MSEHTPTPWAMKAAVNGIDRDFGIFREGHAGVLAECFEEFEARGLRQPDVARANAEFIVRACNGHEELLEALKLAALHFERMNQHADVNFMGDDEHEVWSALRAAIAKAEGR